MFFRLVERVLNNKNALKPSPLKGKTKKERVASGTGIRQDGKTQDGKTQGSSLGFYEGLDFTKVKMKIKIKNLTKKYIFRFPAAALACVFMLLVFLMPFAGVVNVYASKMDRISVPFSIDGGAAIYLDAYEANYEGNIYLSMRSLAKALTGTAAQFRFYNDESGAYQIDKGLPYDPSLEPEIKAEKETDEPDDYAADEEEELTEEEKEEIEAIKRPETIWLAIANNWVYIDGASVNYYTYANFNNEDLYASLLDVGMMLDLNIVYSGGVYYVDTSKHFSPDLEELDNRGYFDYLHGMAVGDITTGEIFLSCHGDVSVPIASTTKLMTYLVVKRFIELGRISEDDIVTISANAARVSTADDGVVYMYEGEQTTVKELLYAMLVASSNESALALAEYTAGSETEFVRLMNKMAAMLGLDSAVFYNPHGLPDYMAGSIVSVVENHMSAEDLFKLARAVILKYPEVEEITSTREIWLDGLWVTLNNTNSLLANMPDVFGLKTGTTDAAGKCLVAARRLIMGGQEHIIVSVVLGAEFNSDRVETSQLLLIGAQRYLNNQQQAVGGTPMHEG